MWRPQDTPCRALLFTASARRENEREWKKKGREIEEGREEKKKKPCTCIIALM